MPRKVDKNLIAATTIRITHNQREILEQLKITPSETYRDVLDRLLKFVMMKPEEFVKELGLPYWVFEKIKELQKMMDEEKETKKK